MPRFNNSDKIAFVHSDMDIYEPIKVTLESFWPKLAIGGIILIGKIDNPGQMCKTIAFNEFVNTLNTDTYKICTFEIKEINTLKTINNTYIIKKN